MCVARSRSPSRNQVSSRYRSSIAAAENVSSRMPQPWAAVVEPGQRVHDRVVVGADEQPVALEVVAPC